MGRKQNIIAALESRLIELKDELKLKQKQGKTYRRDRKLDIDAERKEGNNHNTYHNKFDKLDKRIQKRLRKLSTGTAAVNPGGLNNAADGTLSVVNGGDSNRADDT